MARPRLISDEQILSTTRKCVLERGAQVSLDAVAEQLGVTSPALLKRFGTRNDLMLAALRPPESPAWLAEFQKGPDARPLEEQLKDHFARMWDYFAEVVPCISALRECGIPPDKVWDAKKNPAAAAVRAISSWVGQAHEQGLVEAAAPEAVAHAILGALQIRSFSSHVAKVHFSARSNHQYLDDLVHLFTRALTPHRGAKHRTA